MEGKNLGRNQSYILDVAVETIEMKKRKSSTVHENSQPKVAKIPVMIKFVKKEAQVQSNIEESTDSLEKSVQNNVLEEVSNVTKTSNVKEKSNVINYVTQIGNVLTEIPNAKEASILKELSAVRSKLSKMKKENLRKRRLVKPNSVPEMSNVTACGWKKLHLCRICDRTFELEHLLKVA